jgi:LmbE family N-acetylglucosaminyl deacetylase
MPKGYCILRANILHTAQLYMPYATRQCAPAKPFNPADAGTPEEEWLALLRAAPEWAPSPGRLIVVAPHPDDEVLATGGLIHSWACAGGEVCIVSVTDGEAADVTRKGLDLIRRKELQAALRRLSARYIDIRRAGLPDGKVIAHANKLRALLTELALPGTTLLAPYEHDGHPDHEAAGRICGEVARAAGIALARYPVWTWHHTDPASVTSLRWVRFSLTAAAQRAKGHALRCFASQLRPPSGMPVVPAHVLTYFERPYEAFVL